MFVTGLLDEYFDTNLWIGIIPLSIIAKDENSETWLLMAPSIRYKHNGRLRINYRIPAREKNESTEPFSSTLFY